MRVLQPDNTTFSMDDVPEVVDDDDRAHDFVKLLQYCILDYSSQQETDFYFVPLAVLDQFPCPVADLRIGPYSLQMPLKWSVVIGDKNLGAIEIISLQQINDRDMDVFVFNPINGYMPGFLPITVENAFPDILWTMPLLRNGHILAVPLTTGPNPPCAFFVRDTNKLPEALDITKIF